MAHGQCSTRYFYCAQPWPVRASVHDSGCGPLARSRFATCKKCTDAQGDPQPVPRVSCAHKGRANSAACASKGQAATRCGGQATTRRGRQAMTRNLDRKKGQAPIHRSIERPNTINRYQLIRSQRFLAPVLLCKPGLPSAFSTACQSTLAGSIGTSPFFSCCEQR